MKTIIRTTPDGDIIDIIAEDEQESLRLTKWCTESHHISCVENLNIWCNPIKRGTWVKDEKRNDIFKFGSWEKDGRVYNYQGQLNSCIYNSLRPLQEEEILSYLVNEAQNRGFCANRAFRWDSKEDYRTMILNGGWEYSSEQDALLVNVVEKEFKNAIYMDGNWATPVYNCKKKLPKTKLELQIAFYDYIIRFASMKQWLD